MNISEKITSLIQEVLEVNEQEISQSRDLSELGMTSLSFVKIIISLESVFGIKFEDEDFSAEKFELIDDFICYIQEKTN